MKKLLLSWLMVLVCAIAFAQSRTHTIEKGESLEDIARKYGVSVEDITNANPTAKTVVYVGMKLTIPEKKAPQPEMTVGTTATPVVTEAKTSSTEQVCVSVPRYHSYNSWSIDLAFHQMFTTEFSSDKQQSGVPSKYDGFTVGLRFMPGISADDVMAAYVGLDFDAALYSYSKSENKYSHSEKFSYYDLKLPFGLQWNIFANENIYISPFAGLNFSFGLSSKEEEKTTYGSETTKTDINLFDAKKELGYSWNRFNFGYDAGLKITMGHVAFQAAYSGNFTNLYKTKEDATAKVSGFTIGIGIQF